MTPFYLCCLQDIKFGVSICSRIRSWQWIAKTLRVQFFSSTQVLAQTPINMIAIQ
jgi:hypothetical protein